MSLLPGRLLCVMQGLVHGDGHQRLQCGCAVEAFCASTAAGEHRVIGSSANPSLPSAPSFPLQPAALRVFCSDFQRAAAPASWCACIAAFATYRLYCVHMKSTLPERCGQAGSDDSNGWRWPQEHGQLIEEVEAEGAWAWVGGLVPGGLTPSDAVWWNALRKPLGMRLAPSERATTVWAGLYACGALALAVASLTGGIIHQVPNPPPLSRASAIAACATLLQSCSMPMLNAFGCCTSTKSVYLLHWASPVDIGAAARLDACPVAAKRRGWNLQPPF